VRANSLGRILVTVVGGAAMLVLFGGVASAQAPTNQEKKIELTFDLSKCQQQGPNLYKCPAIDKPICTPEFNQPDIVCIHIGKKGSVFVMNPGGASD
jgi:hypothetical protein